MGKFIQWGLVILLAMFSAARLLDVMTGDTKLIDAWMFVVLSALAMAFTFNFNVFKFSPIILTFYFGFLSIVYFVVGQNGVGLSLLLSCAVMVILIQQFMLGRQKPEQNENEDQEQGVFAEFARQTAGDMATAPQESNKATDDSIRSYSSRMPSVKFTDVHGMEKLKKELKEAADDHLKSGKNGILLTGDPGNGKTFIAEALAGELKCGFMPISIGDMKSKWMGQTTEQLQAVFDGAKRSGRVVLFFDECDSLLGDRSGMVEGGGGAATDMLGTTNTFLTNIVDIRRYKGVIVVAATNYPDNLDTAAVREGRFDFKIHIPNPDAEARRGLLNKFSKSKEWKPAIPEDVMVRLVRRWEGFSVSRIVNIGEKILKNAKAQSRKEVSLEDAFLALRQIQGSAGDQIKEDTPTLKDGKLHFDIEMKTKLINLASRLENIDEVERLGGTVPKGAIFWGPPGTGKTAVAMSLAKTSGWAFLATTGSDLLAGDGTGIDKIIKKARDLRPCIVFIDEAEEALGDRSSSRYGSIVTNKLLAVTDGTKALHDVLFVAATNHPDKLDAAIKRGGRFSEHFEFKKPEDDTVLLMVREWITSKAASTPFHEEFVPEVVAKYLEGLAPSDIKDKLQQAVNTGVGRIMSDTSEVEKIMLCDLQAVMR